jgi:hypothetical protein
MQFNYIKKNKKIKWTQFEIIKSPRVLMPAVIDNRLWLEPHEPNEESRV